MRSLNTFSWATVVGPKNNQLAFQNYLLQCFQFLVFSKISGIQTNPKLPLLVFFSSLKIIKCCEILLQEIL